MVGMNIQASFMPVNILQYLKALAQSPYSGTDKLEFAIARAQLLAFNRWKGFYVLPEFKMLNGLLEDGTDIPVKGERKHYEGMTEDAICVPLGNEQFSLRKGGNLERDVLRIESGDLVRALKFITKALRLDRSLAIDDLLSKLEDQLNNKPTNKSSSSLSLSSSYPVAYTEEHISIVREIKGKKRTEGKTVILPSRRTSRDHGRGTPGKGEKREKKSGRWPNQGPSPDAKQAARDGMSPSKKEGRMSDLMSRNPSNLSNVKDEPDGKGGRNLAFYSSVKKRKADDSSVCDESSVKNLDSLPSESNLNTIFRHYGPLNESATEVLKKSKLVKVIFKRGYDAETAFSSTGKFSTVGPSLVRYRLNYLLSTQRKTSTSTKQSRKGLTSGEGNAA
ncbi:PWWP domain-containing protein 5-like [Actinidia eriantha]|uniref:PWWP domain-containing protein 5-like n=1 Tax=Actinidia eriantha TaxID=165200 RepID=UPI00258DBD9D|nr:PWWP domain-containing protein 5-like [Actinidia eriantha]